MCSTARWTRISFSWILWLSWLVWELSSTPLYIVILNSSLLDICESNEFDIHWMSLNYPRLRNKSWNITPQKKRLFSHLPPISQTIRVKWRRYAGYFWQYKEELITDIHQWTLTHWLAKSYAVRTLDAF